MCIIIVNRKSLTGDEIELIAFHIFSFFFFIDPRLNHNLVVAGRVYIGRDEKFRLPTSLIDITFIIIYVNIFFRLR